MYWANNNISIYNEDCLKTMEEMDPESIDLILTDPPYGINFQSNHNKNKKDRIKGDCFEDWIELINKALPLFKKVLKPTGCCCCCGGGGSSTPVSSFFTMEAIKHFYLIQTVIWHKFIGLGWRYRPAYETIVVLSKSKNNYKFYDTTRKCSNVIIGINQKIPLAQEHPTVKPIKLMEHFIKIHSAKNDIVFDPFMGQGTTILAAIKNERRAIGVELEKKYCDILIKNINKGVQMELF